MLDIADDNSRLHRSSRRKRFILSTISIVAGAVLVPLSIVWIIHPLEMGLPISLACFSILAAIQIAVIRERHTIEIETRGIEANFREFLRASLPDMLFYDLLLLSVSAFVLLMVNLRENIFFLLVAGNAIIILADALLVVWPGSPLPRGEFRQISPEAYPQVSSVLERSGIQIHSIGFLQFSKLKIINAYQWGAKKAVIAISDYLEEILTDDELAAIVAHELGHIKYRHFTKLVIAMSVSPLVLINFYFFYSLFNVSQYLDGFLQALLLIALGFLALGVPILVLPWIRRRWEAQADLYAARLAGAEVFASALKKLVDNEVFCWKGDRRIESLLRQPSIQKREDIVT